jgi:hypothetical protein
MGGVDVPRHIKVLARRSSDHVDVLDHALHHCTPTVRLLIALTLPPPLSLFSRSVTGLSAHAPAKRAGAQRLCALA